MFSFRSSCIPTRVCFFYVSLLAMLFGMMSEASNTLLGADASYTTIEITDKVLVDQTIRLGINLGGDTYYSGAALVKKRVQENFEGTSYRQCHFGPIQDENGATTWFRASSDWDEEILPGARYTILSGAAKGATGKIVKVAKKQALHNGKQEDFRYFIFDRKVKGKGSNVGILVESLRLKDGQFRSLDGFWTSKSNQIVIGDVPPSSFGHAALLLDASKEKAHVRFSTHYQRYGETNGLWHVRLHTKSRSGTPRLTIACDRSEYGESKEIEPTRDWKKVELTLRADKVPEPKSAEDNPMLFFLFSATGGEILVDDIEIWLEGDKNPTVFRDDCVDALSEFRPGIIRRLQMGGSTLDNTIAPPLESYSYASQSRAKVGPYHSHSRDSYSLHEMYMLCEYVGADPWYCLPGTLTQEEIAHFMEYLGAPANVGYGRRRAELGHPQPWTEVFDRIHVEFGNEAWNNAGPYQCGGFNGEDYWKDLIATGKKSPYFTKKVLFHVGGQAANSWLNGSLLPRFPNADRLTLAPYILHNFSQSLANSFHSDNDLFRWAFAYPIWRSRNEEGAMYQNYQLAKKAGIEMSIYEINHHITGGDAPLEPRNHLVTSIGGGLNVANCMLLMLKEEHIRDQCLFSFIQQGYKAHNVGVVRLWGTALCLRKGQRRFRPTWLASAIANRVTGGALLETRHGGEQPTFSATGQFRRKPAMETIDSIPAIFSYAFAEGENRGLILNNLSTETKHTVEVKFAGSALEQQATEWQLSADRITASNEFENDQPEVKVRQTTVQSFRSGYRIKLPPFSMTVLKWQIARE